MKSYTTLRNLYGTLTNDSSSTNLTLGDQLINDAYRDLSDRFYFDETTDTFTTTASTQFYNQPYNLYKIVSMYLTNGGTRYTMREAPSRVFWDELNFTTYTSNVPLYYFIFENQIGIWPTPSTSSLTVTVIYKKRVRDLSQADYTTGTISLTNGSTTVTGSGTTFTSAMVGRWLNVTSPSGDGNWYEISTFSSTTVITLKKTYQGSTVSGASFTIGEMPLLPERYHDLPVYRAAALYFETRVPDQVRAQKFQHRYDLGLMRMEEDIGSKTTNVCIPLHQELPPNTNLFVRY
jgi:hypothetical protein